MLVEALANPLMVSSQATGKVKKYQSIVGGTLLLIVPAAYCALRLGCNPETIFVIHLIFALIAQLFRLCIMAPLIQMSLYEYFMKVVLRVILVSCTTSMLTYVIYKILPNTLLYCMLIIGLSILINVGAVISLGLSDSERTTVYAKLKTIIQSKIKR